MKKISRLTALLLALLLIFQMTAVATEDIYVAPTPIPQEHLNAEILATLRNNAVAVAAVDSVKGFGVVNEDCNLNYSFWNSEKIAQGTIVPVYEGTFELLFGIWGIYYKVSYNGQDGYIQTKYLTLCTCNVEEGAGLEAHADSCPDKMYYTSVSALTAAEIYANWANFTEAGQTFILSYLGQNDAAKLAELTGMIYLAGVPACDCGNDGNPLSVHSDGCARKAYFKSVADEKTAEEIYADWANCPVDGKEYIIYRLTELNWDIQYAEKLAALQDLLKSSSEEVLPDGVKVTATGLPEGAILEVEYVSEERIDAAKEFMFEGLYVTPEVDRTHSLQKALNIRVKKDGEEWQPNPGESVDIEIDLGISWLHDKSRVWVTHMLDTKEAIESASETSAYQRSGLSSVYPEECAAAKAAGYEDDTVIYAIMNIRNGGISHNASGKLTIHATSFSDHIITAYNVSESEHLPTIASADQEVFINKEAIFNNETGKGMITIDAYVKGELTSTPTDVVLVIDHSGSMWSSVKTGADGWFGLNKMDKGKAAYEGYYACFNKNKNDEIRLVRYNGEWQYTEAKIEGCYAYEGDVFIGRCNTVISKANWYSIDNPNDYMFYKTITGALHDALYAFQNSVMDAVNCKVAVATFSGTSSNSYDGAGIFVNGTLVGGESHTGDQYKAAFIEPKNLTAIFSKIDTNYGNTPTGLGLHYAKMLLEQGGREGANQVVIVFTDGVPSDMKYGGAEETGNYIIYANSLKNLSTKPTVYSMGPATTMASDKSQIVLNNIATSSAHSFVADSASIQDVFKKIASIIVQSSNALGSSSTFKDIMAPSFKLPSGTTEADIKVYTQEYRKNGGFAGSDRVPFAGAVIGVDEGTETVTVSGFKFDENPVIENKDGGAKLIIEFPFEPIDGFLGGDTVPTNAGASGIYSGSTKLYDFGDPDVNVNLKVPLPEVQNDAIYVSQKVDLDDLVTESAYKLTGSDTVWQVDGKVNAYASIEYTVKDTMTDETMTFTIPAGTTFADLDKIEWIGALAGEKGLEADANYTITTKVISKNSTGHTTSNSDAPLNVRVKVFKPDITFQDSVVDVGDMADYANDNFVSVVWKNGGAEPTDVDKSLLGEEPVLTYTYNPLADAFTWETNVQVTEVLFDAENIMKHVTFNRAACDYGDCPNLVDTMVEHLGKDAWVNFVVHMGTFDLKITKKGLSDLDMDEDETQSTMYKVTNGKGFELTVAIDGNGYVIIKDLPYGTYTVAELTDWSWRYEPKDNAKTISSENADSDGVLTAEFVNTRENPSYWLSGDSYAENAFGEAEDANGKVTVSGTFVKTNGGE